MYRCELGRGVRTGVATVDLGMPLQASDAPRSAVRLVLLQAVWLCEYRNDGVRFRFRFYSHLGG